MLKKIFGNNKGYEKLINYDDPQNEYHQPPKPQDPRWLQALRSFKDFIISPLTYKQKQRGREAWERQHAESLAERKGRL